MSRALALLYAVLTYAFFFITFLYAIGFVDSLIVAKTIDSGAAGNVVTAAVIDLVVLSIFALQHSVMARPAFKNVWTRLVPPVVERTTYVLAATLALALIIWQWRPIHGGLWDVSGTALGTALTVLSLIGFGVVLLSTFLIDHFELFGLRQTWTAFRGGEFPAPKFVTPLFYKTVRHPLYLGFIIAFWATPRMSWGHLLFAAVTTAYMLVAIRFEERDLVGVFGHTYEEYRRRVSMIIPTAPKA